MPDTRNADAVLAASDRANLTVAQVDKLIAKLALYRAVARGFVRWDEATTDAIKTPQIATLVASARDALASESTS